VSKSQGKKNVSPPRRKTRRWLRVLSVLFLLLVALGIAVNGPIARWFVAKTIRDKLAGQGLAGDLTVEGHLHHGFTLRDGHFTGAGSIEVLSFDEIVVEYWILDLIDKKVERIAGRNLLVTANAAKQPKEVAKEGGERKLPDFHSIGNTLRTIRPLVLQVEIDFKTLDLTLKRPLQEPLKVTLGSLKHQPGTDQITIGQIASNALGEGGLPTQDLVLTWEEELLSLGRAQVIPELAVAFIKLEFPTEGSCSCETMIEALATELSFRADDTGMVQIELKERPLDLSKLTHFPDLELAGTVEIFNAEFENLLGSPAQWKGTANLQASDLQWPNGKLALVRADCVLGDELKVVAALASALQVEASAPRPVGDSVELKQWMDGLVIALEVTAPSLHAALQHLLPAAGQAVPDLPDIPEGALALKGTVTLGGERGVSASDLQWSFSDIDFRDDALPDLAGTATLADNAVGATVGLAQPRPEEVLKVTASLNLDSMDYTAGLEARIPDPAWLLPLIPSEDPLWKPVGRIVATWNGNGSLTEEATHKGALQLEELTLTAPQDSLTAIAFEVSYDWPRMVEASSLSLKNGDLWLEGSTKWEKETITISTLRLHDETGPLTNLEGSAPLSLDSLSADKYLAQDEPIDLKLGGHDLKLARLGKLLLLKLPEGVDATLGYDLTIGGTPGSPTLDGQITASEVRSPNPRSLPVLATTITFTTEDERLTAIGTVTEPDGKIVDFNASLPLELKACVKDPEHFKQLPLTANTTISKFALQRLQLFAPALANAEGMIDAEVSVTGALGDPRIAGGATISLDRFPLPDTPFRDVRDSKLVVLFADSQLVVDPATVINCAGGTLTISGTVTMEDREPHFALRLVADHLLAWRNDSFILRNNAQLNLDGPLSAARISGDVQFVESLFYKDIELLPLGVPTAHVPKPKLPQIDQKKAAQIGGIPAPFGNWTLNVGVRTEDPILIRGGNFATGKVTASARVTGTLASPRPSGTVTILDAWARLPLSGKLHVRQGIVTLRPNAPYDPVLDVRGAATIDRTNITLNVYGPISNPKYTLYSDPPLPESEILTLLATGSTIGDLEDADTATMKGAQLAINWLKDRYQVPGRDTPFQKLLTELDDVELNFGENDPFSGRKFNSATLQVAPNWFLSAAVDATGNTRGIVIFSVRFR
jgi:hypothetical protein